MITYSVLLFFLAALFLILGVFIYKGNANLIHDYHQTRIKESEKNDYCKAFSKGMFLITLTLIVSGMVALIGKGTYTLTASVAILFIGIVISLIILTKAQKKYNRGLF